MPPREIIPICLTVLIVLSFQSFCFAFAFRGIDSSPRHSPQSFHFPRSLFPETDDQTKGVSLLPEQERDDNDIMQKLVSFSEQEKEDNEVSNTESLQRNKRMYLKRRKGPTLSVVNPLEILRQQLMLDLARRRIHQNERQIVANTELLENLGKRSDNLVDNIFQFQNPQKSKDETSSSDERSGDFTR